MKGRKEEGRMGRGRKEKDERKGKGKMKGRKEEGRKKG
jgi:hypothetical protein